MQDVIVTSKSHRALSPLMIELQGRLFDEMSNRSFFALSLSEADSYNCPLNKWRDVVTMFRSTSTDIHEAMRCWALERYTACVFHLVRIAEIGIRGVAKSLGIPDPVKPAERNWGIILKSIKEEMDRRNKAVPIGWVRNEYRAFFDEAYASLDAVRNAWRNPTMHVENKYTGEEAEEIVVAVRAFMRKLASRMNEQGQPLA